MIFSSGRFDESRVEQRHVECYHTFVSVVR